MSGQRKKTLIQRMAGRDAPKVWATEVRAMLNEIGELKRERDEYLAVIDNMATELEDFRRHIEQARVHNA